jgi:hypothetical protein
MPVRSADEGDHRLLPVHEMSIRVTAVVAALATLLAAAVEATEVSVAFTRAGSSAALEGEALVRLIPANPAEIATIERRASLASIAAFDVPAGHWQLEVESDAWWHAPQFLLVDEKPGTATIELWPAGIVTGSVALKNSRSVPADVRLRFQSAADPPELPSHEVFCGVAQSKFRCKVPAGRADLRLRSPGFLPRYYWDTTVSATAPASLGAVVLEKGASLTGTVAIGAGVTLDARERENVQVVATPANAQLPLHASALGRYTVRAGKRGHFHLDGLPPGDYVVRAGARKLLVSDEVHVVVLAGTVAELSEPLRIEPPSTVRVAVTPPLDPWGERWRVTLTRATPAGESELAAKTPLGENGQWVSPPVRSGRYTVDIESGHESHRGGAWASRELALPADSAEIFIELAAVKLTGTVTLGDRPLESALRFQSPAVPSIEMSSDREGKFEGYLPRTDDAKWTVVAASKDPHVRHTFHDVEPERSPDSSESTLNLRVPLTTLSGFVVDERGQVVTDAIVNVTSPAETLVQTLGGDDGYFAVYGLPPGTYRVQAVAFLAESDVRHVHVTDDLTPDPLQLVVTSQQKITGRVASDVAPVVGAEIQLASTDVFQQLIMPAMTDFRGEFRATAPPGARELDVIVGAPGFDVRLFHTRTPDGPMELRVVQQGGRIVVPASAGDLHPYLQHSGATMYVGQSQVRGLQAHLREGEPRQVILWPLEPGPYSLCMLRHAEQPLLRAGLLDRTDRCTEGFLPPHGELTFAAPPVLR